MLDKIIDREIAKILGSVEVNVPSIEKAFAPLLKIKKIGPFSEEDTKKILSLKIINAFKGLPDTEENREKRILVLGIIVTKLQPKKPLK